MNEPHRCPMRADRFEEMAAFARVVETGSFSAAARACYRRPRR